MKEFWLLAFFLFLCVPVVAQGTRDLQDKKAAALEARFKEAFQEWSDKPEETRENFAAMQSGVFDELTQDEIRLIASEVHSIEIEQEAFRRWGSFDPRGALKAVRAIEDDNIAEIRRLGTGLEGGAGEAVTFWVFELYLEVFNGWSKNDAVSAWQVLKKREGALAGSLAIDPYSNYLYRMFFERLGEQAPDLAFQELLEFRAEQYEELLTADMLAGYLRGVPRGRDWKDEIEMLLKQYRDRGWRREFLYTEIRTGMVGRWLEDSPEAALAWFSGGEIEDLHWSYQEAFVSERDFFLENSEQEADSDEPENKREMKRHLLGRALGYWAGRDFPAAWKWMRTYSGFQEEGFPGEVFWGMSHFFREEGWGELPRSRSHCLRELPLLQEQGQRDQFALHFAERLWFFDDSGFLGEPAPEPAKWLETVRNSFSGLKLSSETEDEIIEKLRSKIVEPVEDLPAADAPEAEVAKGRVFQPTPRPSELILPAGQIFKMRSIQLGLLVSAIIAAAWPFVSWRRQAKALEDEETSQQWAREIYWATTGSACFFLSSAFILGLLVISSVRGSWPLGAWLAPGWVILIAALGGLFVFWQGLRLKYFPSAEES